MSDADCSKGSQAQTPAAGCLEVSPRIHQNRHRAQGSMPKHPPPSQATLGPETFLPTNKKKSLTMNRAHHSSANCKDSK